MKRRDTDNLPVRTFEKNSENFDIVALSPIDGQPSLKIEAHRHDYYHILFIKEGNGKHIIDFVEYKIEANMIFFISPGQVHELFFENPFSAFVITFRKSFFQFYRTDDFLLQFPFFYSLQYQPLLKEIDHSFSILIHEIYKEYHSCEEKRIDMIRSLMEVLLIKSYRDYNHNTTLSITSQTSQIHQLENYIESHYKTLKKQKDYADLMNLSIKQLNTITKKTLNKTIINLIHERTILEAKRLLAFTEDTITEIADELGFVETSYFMRFFKKNVGVTANVYRLERNRET